MRERHFADYVEIKAFINHSVVVVFFLSRKLYL